MDLSDLGFDEWFQKERAALQHPECGVARITRVDRDRYLVRNETREIPAEAAGKLLFAADSGLDIPCVGDWALVQYYDDGALAIIHEMLPRRTFLRRKSPGKNVDYQMLAANIDVALIMQSCDVDFSVRRLERYLVMVNEGHVTPVVLLSKSDLLTPGDVNERVSGIRRACIDADVIAFSNMAPDGPDTVRRILKKGKTYCLLGSSGVGKTTLLNHLLACEAFETAPVRVKDGKGRHTTARRQLSILGNGALLIDTPGMRELGIIAVRESIDDSFSDIHARAASCRFTDCSHTTEAGCAILMAVQSGEVSEERYRSYMKLRKESAFHEMSYVERRRKDKRFGKMIHAAMKQFKKH